MPAPTALPIWKIHADILRTLHAGNRLVLVAPTGSGKTTQVPQMLLDAGIAGDKMIVVLQPRRVAARTVATRIAWVNTAGGAKSRSRSSCACAVWLTGSRVESRPMPARTVERIGVIIAACFSLPAVED